MKNFQEYAQSILLINSILPRLQELHPHRQYCIGHDCGIYWWSTQPLEKGTVVPDWFYVPGVPQKQNKKMLVCGNDYEP